MCQKSAFRTNIILTLINEHIFPNVVVWVVPAKEVVNAVIGFGDAAFDGNVAVGSGDVVVDDWVDICSAIVTDNVVFRIWSIFEVDCVCKIYVSFIDVPMDSAVAFVVETGAKDVGKDVSSPGAKHCTCNRALESSR